MFEFQYAYLVGALLLGICFWLPIYVLRKGLRREMLFFSLLCAPIGPLSEYFYRHDYWRPELFTGWPVGLEDALFGFFIGGIAAVAYEAVFSKQPHAVHSTIRRWYMFATVPICIVWMLVGTFVLGINSVYASIILFVLLGLFIVWRRPDLLRGAIAGGLLLAAAMFVFYQVWIGLYPGIIQEWWLLHNLSGVLISGVPLEELMWAFGWGFVAGPSYEFITGVRYKNKTMQ
jgi:hypothetical protein